MISDDMGRKAIHNPAFLFWLLRAHSIESSEQLYSLFENSDACDYLPLTLEKLQNGNLIDWDGERKARSKGRIKINTDALKILDTLGASLTELANRTHKTIYVEPLFPMPYSSVDSADVFVLMPFTQELKPVYEDHLKSVCDNCGFSVARADDFFNAHEIMSDVWTAIYQSRVVIGDCTGRNPNVFYELGIAHTMGKPVVLITQSKDDVPFDIKHRRYIKYDFTPRGMKKFENNLKATLNTIKESENTMLKGGRYE